MITAESFKEALKDRIERMTNYLTVADRFEGKAKSGYALIVTEKESKIIDGGRQLDRAFEVTIVIFHSKLESENGTMKKRLYDSIFPYFEVADRRFVPLEVRDTRKEGSETVAFTVRFCDTLDRETPESQLMGNFTFNIISGGTNGITTDSHQL
ncbi:MAG: hypothetical protein IJE55_02610 [Clostridia bacterium]|nr:hypothetical protein [Clostridia bacterium]